MRFMKSSKSLSFLVLTILVSSCSPVTTPVVNVQTNPTFTNSPNQTSNQNPISNTTQKTEQTQDNTVSSENNNIEGYDGFQNQSKEKIDSTEDTDGLGGNSSNVYQYNGVGFYGQCVPAARRYIKAKYGYSFPFLGGIGNTGAYLFWENAKPDSNKMERIVYTGNNFPQPDDIIIYKPWKTNPYGHIAITKSVDNNGNITVVDSNWVKYEKGGEHVVKKSELSLIYGWYRPVQNKNNSTNQNQIVQQPVIQQPVQVIQKQNKSPIINSIDISPINAEVSIGGTQIVTLKSNVSDPDGDNLTYEWWFNNVMQRTGQNDSIELGKGTHVIKFQVRDGNGGIATQEKTIVITEKQAVTPPIQITPPTTPPVITSVIVPNQSNSSIVMVFFRAGDTKFPAGVGHIFRLKNGKRSHYVSVGSILADNFNETEINSIDYNTFINNYVNDSDINQPSLSIQKELSTPDIYLVIEADPTGLWGRYKRRFANVQTLQIYLGYFNLQKETLVSDGTLSNIPLGKDIVR